MTNNSFDLTISFDKAEYLNPQLYMMVDTLKENIPKDTILHITTNRDDKDPVLQWIQKQVPTRIYKKPPFKDLKSRCQYMFHCFDIKTNKPWVIKTEIDVLFLKHLDEFQKTLDREFEVILQMENRKIFDDSMEDRLWRIIYKAMNIKLPDIRLPYVENKEVGRPLLATGVVCVQTKHLDYINKNWIPLTKTCENWIHMNIHPNEFAFTAMILNAGWDFKLFNDRFNYNPIGHFRNGLFPSTELIENCIVPEDTVVFDYHRFPWLSHVAKYNPKIKEIIDRNKQFIPENIWNMSFDSLQEI